MAKKRRNTDRLPGIPTEEERANVMLGIVKGAPRELLPQYLHLFAHFDKLDSETQAEIKQDLEDGTLTDGTFLDDLLRAAWGDNRLPSDPKRRKAVLNAARILEAMHAGGWTVEDVLRIAKEIAEEMGLDLDIG